ncbi:hypothetical protein H103_02408, partial [Trichophyton rubrum CBS 288.86]
TKGRPYTYSRATLQSRFLQDSMGTRNNAKTGEKKKQRRAIQGRGKCNDVYTSMAGFLSFFFPSFIWVSSSKSDRGDTHISNVHARKHVNLWSVYSSRVIV